jgi:hypothetical protein
VSRAVTRLALVAAVLAACCLQPLTASAHESARLAAPTSGAVLPLGVPPTFALRDAQAGMAALEVSDSAQTDAGGVFTHSVWSTGYDGRAGKEITVSPARSSAANRFWNRPGTYYWHLYRVDCPVTGPRPHTCSQRATTATRSFTISSHALALTVARVHRTMRLGEPLAVRIGCSRRCRVTVTILAGGKRLFDAAAGRRVSETAKTYRFRPGKRWAPLERMLGARKSLRLTIKVTARNRYGRRGASFAAGPLLQA